MSNSFPYKRRMLADASLSTIVLLVTLVAAVTVAVTSRVNGAEGTGIIKVQEAVPGDWRPTLSYENPVSKGTAQRPTGFPTEAECLAFIESDEGKAEIGNVDMAYFFQYQAMRTGVECVDVTPKQPT